jgi:inhibitor of KinA
LAAEPSITAYGDAALLVSFEQRIDPQINAQVHYLAAQVRADGVWGAPVPAYASLLVPYDPLGLSLEEAFDRLSALVALMVTKSVAPDRKPPVDILVRYGGDAGPDLTTVAERTGLTSAQVIELHSGTTYRAYMLGFAPGFAYLGAVPDALRLPRRATPRQRVPAGSVAIAAAQTAVYPLATPGGWHLIGRTDAVIWDARRDPPALIEAGREVRFVPLDE